MLILNRVAMKPKIFFTGKHLLTGSIRPQAS